MAEHSAIFQMLGVEDEGQAMLRITNIESFINSVKESVGASDTSSALSTIQTNAKFVASVLAATEKSPEEAVGVINAWKQSHVALAETSEKLSKAEAELKSLKETSELDRLVAQAKSENKLTPASEETIRKQFADGEVTLKGVETWLKTLHPIKALQNVQQNETVVTSDPGNHVPEDIAGKAWNELTGAQRVQLRKINPQAYDDLKKAAGL